MSDEQFDYDTYEDMPDPKFDAFVQKLNGEVLNKIDYDLLHQSFMTERKVYAKKVLEDLHSAFTDIYGNEPIDRDNAEVLVPAVIQSRTKDDLMLLGLVILTPEDSGEHWGTEFLTPYGVISDTARELSDVKRAFLKEIVPYDYYYTADMPCDHHVDWSECPLAVRELLDGVGAERDYNAESEWE